MKKEWTQAEAEQYLRGVGVVIDPGRFLYLPEVGPGLTGWSAVDYLVKQFKYITKREPIPKTLARRLARRTA